MSRITAQRLAPAHWDYSRDNHTRFEIVLFRGAGFLFIGAWAMCQPQGYRLGYPPPPWCSRCAGAIGGNPNFDKRWCWHCKRIDDYGQILRGSDSKR